MSEKGKKEVNVNVNINKGVDSSELEQPQDGKVMEADSAKENAEMAKLTADLEDLRQTLLRRQADFENYRKRIEKERFEDSKRAAVFVGPKIRRPCAANRSTTPRASGLSGPTTVRSM